MKIHSFLILAILTISISAQEFKTEYLEGIKPRSIGPAGMSGRVTSIDVVISAPDIIYVGTASGGLWRSTSGGAEWEPIFDDQPAASIGAVAVDQNIPDIIWAGTGEGNPRNSQTMGRGIFKSLDGGKHWKLMGLENTRTIHRIIIDPRNSDVVYAASLGDAWKENKERGVFKTTDGGETWNKILFVNDTTGCADLTMDPENPNKLVAAMWQYYRKPWFFKSGGKGSGLYVTFDGGETWKKRTAKDGLPKGELGRIGLAIAPSAPKIIYALVEAKKNALYKSTDGGFKWKKVSDKNIGNRPFYYADIFVDPDNENRIYNLHSTVTLSEDGGKTFETLIPWSKIHPDHQAFWVNPKDGSYLLEGNDGGMAISRDRGKTWRFIGNLPLAQFYHINVDRDFPYNVYGGMQDNGSWKGPSRVRRWGGIRNSAWEDVGFGDGFDVVPYLPDTRYGYGMSQGGNLYRYDALTGGSKNIQPYHPEGKKLRFNWNAPIAQDPFNSETIYYGSQFLHISTDMGNTWKIISPDLTTNDSLKQKQDESGGLTYDVTDAENYTTIISIAPSPLKKDLIWAGTDDGNVQLTKDGGSKWTNLIENFNGAPDGGWVAQIRASAYSEKEAWVVINNYRKGDWTPYLFFTDDLGESWTNLTEDKNVDGYALSVVQDPVDPDLVFMGTEFGLWFSTDKGDTWTKWDKNYPTVSTMDLAFQPDENDLVIGTFGRAAYIIDNISPLRTLTNKNDLLTEKTLKMFDIPDAYIEYNKRPAGSRFATGLEYIGKNESPFAMLTFWLVPDTSKKGKKLKLKIKVFDESGNNIRNLEPKVKRGFNRTYWYLNAKGIRFPGQKKPKPDAKERGGAGVLPGKYKVVLSYGQAKDSAFVDVKFDNRVKLNIDDLRERKDLLEKMTKLVNAVTEAVDNLDDMKKTLELFTKEAKRDTSYKTLTKSAKTLLDTIKSMCEEVIQPETKGIKYDDSKILPKLRRAYWTLQSYHDKPGEREKLAMGEAGKKVKPFLEKVNSFAGKEWKEIIGKIINSGFTFFKEPKQIELKN